MANYKAQGCGFIGICVIIGWLLFLGSNEELNRQVSSDSAKNGQASEGNNQKDDEALAGQSDKVALPNWILGTWAPVGECDTSPDQTMTFRPIGTFFNAQMKGTYEVSGNQIQLHDVEASKDVLKEVMNGKTEGSILFTKKANGEVTFGSQNVEKCDLDV